jgi:hypothetical protein
MVRSTPFIESLPDKGGQAAGKYKCLWWKKLPLEGEHKELNGFTIEGKIVVASVR